MKTSKLILIILSIASINAYAVKNQQDISTYFETIKHEKSGRLEAFLSNMPKGGDIHSHISGTPYAENLITLGKGKSYCIHELSYTVGFGGLCNNPPYLPFDTRVNNPQGYEKTIDAWSMRNFDHTRYSGHDHFFAAFIKTSQIVKDHPVQVLAELVERAGRLNVQYLELMSTPDKGAGAQMGSDVGWTNDFDVMYSKIMALGKLENIEKQIYNQVSTELADARKLLNCDSPSPKPGCDIEVKYIYQVARNQAPERVFAQVLTGLAAAAAERSPKRVVGLNFVQAEDGEISLKDYALHMEIVKFLKTKYPSVKVSLHAGELTPEYVKDPKDLTFHIKSAVEVAGANRIGHGVDITYEKDHQDLLKEMAKNKVLVEINLTSNKEILKVTNKADEPRLRPIHPLPLYLANNVPVAISTDDEGILRTNIADEYKRAVDDYRLTYPQLKNISRNSLEYGFMLGGSLWSDNGGYKIVNPACQSDKPTGANNPSAACQAFLTANEKARLQWKLEGKFTEFEKSFH